QQRLPDEVEDGVGRVFHALRVKSDNAAEVHIQGDIFFNRPYHLVSQCHRSPPSPVTASRAAVMDALMSPYSVLSSHVSSYFTSAASTASSLSSASRTSVRMRSVYASSATVNCSGT